MRMVHVVRTLLAAAAAAALAWGAPAFAHHGWSGYEDEPEQFTGEIREVQYGNPHVTIRLEAGEETWHVILAPPARMQGRGLPRDALAVGGTATIEAYRHQSGRSELRAEWIQIGEKRTELR